MKPTLSKIEPRDPSGCRFIALGKFAFALPGAETWSADEDPEAEFYKRLTDEELNAVGNYQGSHHEDVNSLLRDGAVNPFLPHAISSDEALSLINFLDQALSKAPLCEEDIGYRGFQSPELWLEALEGDLEGSIFQDDGFCSLAINEEDIPYYVCGGASGGGIAAEDDPKGCLERGNVEAQVYATISLPLNVPLVTLSSLGCEPEIVLPRGSCFVVHVVDIRGATLYLELEYLGIPLAELETRQHIEQKIAGDLDLSQ